MARIFIIDDESGIRTTLSDILADDGHETVAFESGEEALARLAREDAELVLLDVWLPGIDGMAVLERIREILPGTPVIMISGHASVETAVRATRLGAWDFLEKPLSMDRVLLTVKHALANRRLRQEVQHLRSHLSLDESMIGESAAMTKLQQQIRSAAASASRVLITGENGSGKEIVARSLHRLSPRSGGPFVDVNCAAIPEELIESELFGHRRGAFTGATEDRKGKFEIADGGTLFLDEIGDMSLRTQAKVLRVLQEQQFQRVGAATTVRVDVRVLAATNKNLEEEIRRGSFREDLYFRLAVIPLHVPPLRERGEDVLLLSEHFLRRFAAESGRPARRLDASARAALLQYPWPGNVRELRNVIERVTILASSETVTSEDLSLPESRAEGLRSLPTAGTLRDAREAFEREFIVRRLEALGGNVSRTAESLGIERSNLYRKLGALGLRTERDARE